VTAPLLVRALRGEPVERIPAWVMRQAGRYLPEYRALKEKHGFLGLMTDPALAAEVTLQPIRRFPRLDAAILFSDIMTPLLGMGVGLEFDPGPVLASPIRTRAAVEALRPLDPERGTGFVAGALRRVRKELPAGVALLGFAGAPFTVASYLVEGGGGKGKGDVAAIRRLAGEDPDTLHLLLSKVADATAAYLRMQIAAGADAVQIFDTWGALLPPDEWESITFRYTRSVLDGLAGAGVPVILYVGGARHALAPAAAAGAAAASVDHHLPLGEARAAAGPKVALQGNLDPGALLAPPDEVRRSTERVVREGGPRRYVFNLGHGIRPETPLESVEAMLETVHRVGAEICAAAEVAR
jgi:uroporphyrinogen decarboxylase